METINEVGVTIRIMFTRIHDNQVLISLWTPLVIKPKNRLILWLYITYIIKIST